MCESDNPEQSVPEIPPELIEELRCEFEQPSDATVPDLPEFSAGDGGMVVVRRYPNARYSL